MTPQEEAYYAEIIKRLIAPPGSPTDHPPSSMRDLGGIKGVPRKQGVSMFSRAEAAQNEQNDQSVKNYEQLDQEIARTKDPKIKMELEAEKQRLLQESVTVKPYTGDSGQQGLTNNPEPSGEFDAALPPPPPPTPRQTSSTPMLPPLVAQQQPLPPQSGSVDVRAYTGDSGMQGLYGLSAPDPWAIPSGPVPSVAAPQPPPGAAGGPPAVAAAPIAPSPPVAPGPSQAPVAPPVGQAPAIAPPVPPAPPMPASGAQSGQPPPMGVQGPQSAPPPGGMDPWAAAGTQLDPKIAPGPPQTPEERDRRASGWKVFLNKLQTDPNLQAMFLKMGTQMMQPVQPGQTSAGHFGAALQSGVDYAVQGSEMKRKGDLEAKRSSREDQALTSDLASQKQARETGAAAESRAATRFKPEMAALAAKIKSADTADKAAMAELELFNFRLGHKEEIFKNEQDDIKAGTRQKNTTSDFYESGGRGSAAGAKAALTKQGAAEAVAYFDRIVTAENKLVNGKKKPGDKGYETMEKTAYRLHFELPNSLQTIMKAITEATGGGVVEEPIGEEKPKGAVLTEDLIQQHMKALDDEDAAKKSRKTSTGSYSGGRIGPRSDN